jgi:probable rRNA maturation factor
MVVDVFAADEQRERAVDLERWAALARAVLEDRGIKGDAEVSLLFVDTDAIAALNQEFLHKDGPTDVLSFPIEDEPAAGGRFPDLGGTGPGDPLTPAPPALLGDVVLCPEVAARNAEAHGVTYDDEMALLVVHGLLHLLGMDHEEDAEAEKMERLERKLLARFHRPSGPHVGAASNGGAADAPPGESDPADSVHDGRSSSEAS